ncbi:Na+/H+ antiporter NhaA [Prolixibacteraceae bacterium JC049]|nr:Na+/H+ antiporter NhaA [Prolixibacteraceae bacterium JC049]
MISKLKEKKVFSKIKDPLVEFVRLEAFGGIVLMVFTVLALIFANSPLSDQFLAYWKQYVGFQFGDWQLKKTLIHWINDGLMAIFFFVVGLEIKREMLTGALSSIKQASLPIFAAIGGMLVPALIYIFLNGEGPGSQGWGVPMATDIAFALGVLILLGKRIPLSLKLLLTSIAIVDDIGAVMVIAIYYTSEISWSYLLYGGGIYIVLWMLNLLNVRKVSVYLILGIILWYMLLKSGVHATLAGVMLAFTIPAKASRNVPEFIKDNTRILTRLNKKVEEGEGDADQHSIQSCIGAVEDNCVQVISPLLRLEHFFHSWVAYLIIPVFAFANAGVVIDAELITKVNDPVFLGILFGLLLGKPIGIFLFSYLSAVVGWSQKPLDVSWKQIVGIGFLGGIGFTMSFFVSQLAFLDENVLSLAKLGVLVASLIAGSVGFALLRFGKK